MDKIFLSHSSKNKDYVRPIFEYFGGDRCVFDEMTFEIGMQKKRYIMHKRISIMIIRNCLKYFQ